MGQEMQSNESGKYVGKSKTSFKPTYYLADKYMTTITTTTTKKTEES